MRSTSLRAIIVVCLFNVWITTGFSSNPQQLRHRLIHHLSRPISASLSHHAHVKRKPSQISQRPGAPTPSPTGTPSPSTLVHITNSMDFALLLPRNPGGIISDAEREAISFCYQSKGCARTIPDGFITGVHMSKDSSEKSKWIQVTGCIDPSKYNLSSTDDGGQFDVRFPQGAQCSFGGYGASFIEQIEPSASRFCLRCCSDPDDQKNCNSHHDRDGCLIAVPGITFHFCDAGEGHPYTRVLSSSAHYFSRHLVSLKCYPPLEPNVHITDFPSSDIVRRLGVHGTAVPRISGNDFGENNALELDVDGRPALAQPSEVSFNKLVVAHHMVGNTYSYTQESWYSDLRLASCHGIDGFALNVGKDPWQSDQVSSAFAAAEGSPFKLFLSFDMTSLPCSKLIHAQTLRKYITTYADHPNQLKWGRRMVVSTFGGEYSTFGQEDVNSGWKMAVKDGMPPIHFIPSFFTAPSVTYPVTDGYFNWNGAWPMGNHNVTFDTDIQRIASNGRKTYMGAVSPWFFTHYGPTSWNKNWIYRGDEWLYNTRWEQLIHNRDRVDIVQILTWNDYGESNYIGPIRIDQPNSQAWVDGYSHHGWLQMTKYYATAFKNGTYPAIQKDAVYAWARPHPAAATAADPSAPQPANADWTQDYLWVVAFTVSPAQVTLISGVTSQTFAVPSGVTKLKLASSPGKQSAKITRDHVDIVILAAEGFSFDTNPQTFNFNAFVAASP